MIIKSNSGTILFLVSFLFSCKSLSLFSYGFGGRIQWIDAFLCYRQQRVVVNGVKSDKAPVVPGVPLLFSLHINDINSDIESAIRLFADDCVCDLKIKNVEYS